MRLINMVAIPMLLAFGVSAMGTAFTFYEKEDGDGDEVGPEDFEPDGQDSDVCASSDDGIRSVKFDRKFELWEAASAVAQGDVGDTLDKLIDDAPKYCVWGFKDEDCDGCVEFVYQYDFLDMEDDYKNFDDYDEIKSGKVTVGECPDDDTYNEWSAALHSLVKTVWDEESDENTDFDKAYDSWNPTDEMVPVMNKTNIKAIHWILSVLLARNIGTSSFGDGLYGGNEVSEEPLKKLFGYSPAVWLGTVIPDHDYQGWVLCHDNPPSASDFPDVGGYAITGLEAGYQVKLESVVAKEHVNGKLNWQSSTRLLPSLFYLKEVESWGPDWYSRTTPAYEPNPSPNPVTC